MTSQDKVVELLRRLHAKVFNKPGIARTGYATVPEKARVKNSLSNKAQFSDFLLRRRGYIIHVSPAELIKLRPQMEIDAGARELFESQWRKGIIWSPIRLHAEVVGKRWVLEEPRALSRARFLASKGQALVVCQILEDEDLPATTAKLELLKRGLYNAEGSRCPVVLAKVAY